MSMKRRIAGGMGANAFGQAITIGVQLLSLPLYLRHWDLARYGTWLMLSAVPSYFSMADIGMVTAAGNKMTMDVGRGDLLSANRTFHSALVFMLATCSIIFVCTWLLLPLLNFEKFGGSESRHTVGLLISAVLLAFFNGLTEAMFRATGRYGLGTALGNATRLTEWTGGLIGLWIDGSFSSVALGMLIARAIGLSSTVAYSAATTQSIKWGFQHASAAEIRVMAKPAAMSMVFPLSSALSLQGFTLLVGGLFGPAVTAAFNTYRTLARVTVQATSMLSLAVGPEISRLYGASNREALKRLFERADGISAALAPTLPLVVGLVSPLLLSVWTHDRIAYSRMVLWPMLAYASLSSLWHVPRVFLLSINRHSTLAAYSLLVAALSLFAAWGVGKAFSLTAIVLVLVFSELVMVIIARTLSKQVLKERVVRRGEVLEPRLT